MRTCKSCGQIKPIGDFQAIISKKYPGRAYRRYLCKPCYCVGQGRYALKYRADGRYDRQLEKYKADGRYSGKYKVNRKESRERYRLLHPSADEWLLLKKDPVYMEGKRARARKSYERESLERKMGKNLAKWIVVSSKNNDRNRRRENDLTEEFVQNMIADGCSYCGDTAIRVGLDRIDNSIGHLKSNVVAACCRCNLIRGEMPYAAWLRLIPAIKQAFKDGLFGSWLPPIARKYANSEETIIRASV